MKIPEKIKIGGVGYSVVYEERLNTGSKLAYGHIDYDKAIIQIEPKLQDYQGMCQTLLHEILHGVADDRQIDFKNADEERIVNQFANGLYQVIQDNPDLFGSDTDGKEETT